MGLATPFWWQQRATVFSDKIHLSVSMRPRPSVCFIWHSSTI